MKARPKKRARPTQDATTTRFERALKKRAEEKYMLRLYITGMTPRSMRAIENLRAICEEHLHGRYDLEIIDIFQHPQLVQGEQIVAAPTLIKKLPAPLRRVVGDLSNKDRVVLGLDLRPRRDKSSHSGEC
jgi:circadian clock protein KaiB